MLRKLIAAVAALLFVAGFGLAAPAQARSVLPAQGHYTGMDHAGRAVTFSFSGNQMSHFRVGGHSIGGAHVSHGAWHETCHNGYCTRGHWQTDTHVVGAWRVGGSHHWTAFSANAPSGLRPYRGNYLGSDHGTAQIRLSFNGSNVHGFTVNGHGTFPSVHVSSHGQIPESCGHDHWCFKGHWLDDHNVVGYWKHGVHGGWHAWEARAISS